MLSRIGRQISRRFSTVPPIAHNTPLPLITTLPNGVRVASQVTHDEMLTVGVWVDSGSRFECQATNGVAHFLEHMAFKGTKKRTRLGLEKEIENMGAHLNAYTSREQTVYYAKVFKEDLRAGLDILSDILNHSTYDNNHLEMERAVILREMEEIEKSNEEVIFDRLHLTAFPDSPLGYTILGPEENIRSISRQNLVDYITQHYRAERCVIAAAGPVDHEEFVKHAADYFNQWKPSPPAASKEPKPKFHGNVAVFPSQLEDGNAHIAVAFEGVSWRSEDSLAFMVMQAIIGTFQKQSSFIPDKLSANKAISGVANRLENGCAESFSAYNTCYKDTGIFGFYAVCEERAIEPCLEELMGAINNLAWTVTPEEVSRAKRQLRLSILGSLDSTMSVAEDIGRQLLVYDRYMPIPEFLTRLEIIDAEEIQRVAKKYLLTSPIACVAMGAVKTIPDLAALRRTA